MADEREKFPQEPAEGSRKTVEHELERQSGGSARSNPSEGEPGEAGQTEKEESSVRK